MRLITWRNQRFTQAAFFPLASGLCYQSGMLPSVPARRDWAPQAWRWMKHESLVSPLQWRKGSAAGSFSPFPSTAGEHIFLSSFSSLGRHPPSRHRDAPSDEEPFSTPDRRPPLAALPNRNSVRSDMDSIMITGSSTGPRDLGTHSGPAQQSKLQSRCACIGTIQASAICTNPLDCRAARRPQRS